MSENNDQNPFLLGRMWGKKWTIISAIIVIVTGVALFFFDQTDDAAYDPLDPRPPAYKDTTEKGPVRLLDEKDDTINDEY